MESRRLKALDGWRACSILLVLACHLLPLGYGWWSLSGLAGLAGMALFFTLSGFLITTNLAGHPSIPPFLIRRFCRIEPLALTASVIFLAMQRKGIEFYPSHLLYYLNYASDRATIPTGHLWSLCVEVHFYLGVALLVLALGVRGLHLLPAIGFAITAIRIQQGETASFATHLRCDEILAGAWLALIWLDHEAGRGGLACRVIKAVPAWAWGIAFAMGCLESSGPLQYARPYLAMALVGSSILNPIRGLGFLESRSLRYIAEISFALYVIHPICLYGWFASGGVLARYSKRMLGLAITFGLAHASTFYFEHPWMAWGKRLARHFEDVPIARPRTAEVGGPAT